MVGEEEAVAEAVATVAAAEVEAAEVRSTPVLAPVAKARLMFRTGQYCVRLQTGGVHRSDENLKGEPGPIRGTQL